MIKNIIMKNKILMLVLLSLSGCIDHIAQGDKIKKIESDGTTCLYKTGENAGLIFMVPCELYHVGDTVKFVK